MYSIFLGIDIGKFEFVVAAHENTKIQQYTNDTAGIKSFIAAHKSQLPTSFVVLEATGGYEKMLLETLSIRGIAVHRADARKVKYFIKSERMYGKTDASDAILLALYGFERHLKLPIHKPIDAATGNLKSALTRRIQLTKDLVAEKNFSQAPGISDEIKQSSERHIAFLTNEIEIMNEAINTSIKQDSEALLKREILSSIPGIGQQVSAALIGLAPELGRLNRREIASLLGVAPHPYESGMRKGYRAVKGGRLEVRTFLFMASMAARSSNSYFKEFYERLIAKGKKKMVALTALMRKILLVANALLKQFYEKGTVCMFVK
jgi:transposase